MHPDPGCRAAWLIDLQTRSCDIQQGFSGQQAKKPVCCLRAPPRSLQGTGLSYSGKLMAVGRARMDGVEVHGNAQLLGMSGFEAYANSTAHRPAQFTFTSSGQSLQVVLITPMRACAF